MLASKFWKYIFGFSLSLFHTPIRIIKAFNIILAQIITDLHFNHLQWYLTTILQAMFFINRKNQGVSQLDFVADLSQ